MGIFRIDVNDFRWINGPEDDPQDLCLHGHVTVQIGDTVLEDDGTVSATALYLFPNGTDWSTIHEGDSVRLILPSGQEEIVELSVYQEEVLRFAEKVEAFYNACALKELPTNEYDRNGYIAFRNEWHRRYTEAREGTAKT